jgi:hypothetical protein
MFIRDEAGRDYRGGVASGDAGVDDPGAIGNGAQGCSVWPGKRGGYIDTTNKAAESRPGLT